MQADPIKRSTSDVDLRSIKAALAGMSESELDTLSETTYKVDQFAPALLAWLDSACVWQVQHRVGIHYELQPPETVIPPEQGDISIDAAIVVRRFFLQDSPAVHALFDAVLERLTGGDGQKH